MNGDGFAISLAVVAIALIISAALFAAAPRNGAVLLVVTVLVGASVGLVWVLLLGGVGAATPCVR